MKYQYLGVEPELFLELEEDLGVRRHYQTLYGFLLVICQFFSSVISQ